MAERPAQPLLASLASTPWFEKLAGRIEAGRSLAVAGLTTDAAAAVIGLLRARLRRRILVVAPDDVRLEAYHRDLAALAPLVGGDPRRLAVLPSMDADPYDAIPPHPELAKERVQTLGRLARRELDLLLVPARSLLQWLPSAEELAQRYRVVRPEDQLPPDRFILEAVQLGYRRVETVSAPGEVSRRGGIIDIFPPDAEEPVRLELFGDSVESIRAFDTDHQRSTGELGEAVIGPALESPPTDEAIARLTRYLEGGIARARERQESVRVERERLEQLQVQGYLPGIEALTLLTARNPVSLLDHLAGWLTVVDEPDRAVAELDSVMREIEVSWDESGNRILPAPDELYIEPARVAAQLTEAPLTVHELEGGSGGRETITVQARPSRAYSGRVNELIDDARALRDQGGRIVCLLRAPGGAERLDEIFREYELEATLELDPRSVGPGAPGVLITVAGLRRGFEMPDDGLTIWTEAEIFGKPQKETSRRRRARAAFRSDFNDLREGDPVVHIDHGIARYAGLGRPKGGSLNRDFMVLEFAGRDRLFVPVDRLDVVQRYSGAGAKPTLDRLGGPGWEKVKSRVRKSVQDLAKDLLELYARRQAARGHAFSPDAAWQQELEAAFPYELTPDQARAVEEVKADMESPQPMDRLLVGDVGFGKTEVAVRAAFKAIMDGFQVAVLAPTTVLAFQHLRTFRERYAPFPVRTEMVSRFRSPREIRQAIRGAEAGEVDLLIGTHRLLSKDVHFRRLGLLVVDEEQRFGVAHKERLKKLSVGIDVLSMTATPIPRTLQMSLAGVRDLSVMETPPPGRMAIQTSLVPFRRAVLAQAVRQELRRGGQVFVVHNRVDTLPAVVESVKEWVPDARVEMAHGQMNERRLEETMLRFVDNEADILVTTTIIENGLDIPRANTIIVNRADHFGLAQLYQLRGRVGRSAEHAYAFFVVPDRETLTDEARKRLKALQEFSELGAGFRLAAADLEIRGAGEFLGARQHGHIASLGFELYTQLLENAVKELRGEAVVEKQPVSLHLGVDIKLPESYVPQAPERLALYRRLALTAAPAEIDQRQAETEDRYGHLPVAGRALFDLARLRLVAERAGVRSVDVAEGKLQIRFHDRPPVEPMHVMEIVAREQGKITPGGTVVLPAPAKASARMAAVKRLLESFLEKSAA